MPPKKKKAKEKEEVKKEVKEFLEVEETPVVEEPPKIPEFDPKTHPAYSGLNYVDLFNLWLAYRRTVSHPLKRPPEMLPAKVRDMIYNDMVTAFRHLDTYSGEV